MVVPDILVRLFTTELKKAATSIMIKHYDYICGVCSETLLNPHQTACGHRICGDCLEKLFRTKGDPAPCPYGEDDCVTLSIKDGTVFPDFPLMKELRLIPVPCKYEEYGCKELIQRNLIETHLQKECQYVPLSCPNKCGSDKIIRKELENHLRACPLRPTECTFKLYGCDFKGKAEEVKDHERFAGDHLKMVTSYFTSKLNETEAKLRDKEMREKSQLDYIAKLEERNQQIIVRHNEQLKETQKVVANRGQRILVLEEEMKEIRSMYMTLVREFNEQKEDKKAIQQRMAENDLRFQVLETASYDGTLLWKIKDYYRRKMEAHNNRILSLYSQPFYTSRHGYRMCARVYLNGDGMGSGTHLSLFFVVMRGEYDALLPWPFRAKVTLMLLDQAGKTRHIIDTFRPDPSSSSFQRPTKEMNIASGCPLFVSHAVLEAKDSIFLRDDTIFIKIAVDTSGL